LDKIAEAVISRDGIDIMKRELQGKYVTTSTAEEAVKAFVPSPLPPIPSIEWSGDLRERFDRALLALGRLDTRPSSQTLGQA
jgi:hypothetical protein